ncbi:hypothetical protein C1X98_23935 [Pseudomonas sp. FW306-2-11BA]|uniref:NEL-type E3 ubiquitin ligase domain-containing protein n=1 Tax=Pseudomonas sp. FW306-2-11BA TaxID=2070662 RepID=UPI000C887BC7|nr:DUF6543 domain-containing protein [Pseudomonas sp. FW306-2-11BA]PMZ07689.1 hypothetical protein C1Y06_23575 [Pseudomonas sp. FW306-02-H06C]PNB11050.1 hypothetical protein C1X98_23935 [Pseudomonas sp. FW306-2-11BA]
MSDAYIHLATPHMFSHTINNKNTHLGLIISSIPEWLSSASMDKRDSLNNSQFIIADEYKAAPFTQRSSLKKAVEESWKSQNKLDRMFETLQDINSFAEPLLKTALKNHYGLELDVKKTYLRLYIPSTIPWFPIKTGAARTRTVSLLAAALHNFEAFETQPQAYEPDSCFITEPSPSGQFDILPLCHRIKVHEFIALCRTLDIGAQYKKHLESFLLPGDGLAKAVLQLNVIDSQKAAFNAAAHLALLEKDITAKAHRQLIGLIDGHKGLVLEGQTLLPHTLTMLDTPLTGIVLIVPMLAHRQGAHRVIAYVPDDPEHPVKEYPDSGAFLLELTRQMRSPIYQQFFSRFVAHEQRGDFFSKLNDQLTRIMWHPPASLDPRPTWRETSVERPHLRLDTTVIRDELWAFLFQEKLNKILNDARVIAVPTDDEDRKTRWDRLDRLLSVASTILNIAAFVAIPFVPFLGELMLAYTAYQLLDQTFEGIIDWAEGETTEAFEHLMGVVESVVQLGVLAAGGQFVSTALSVKPSAFVDSLIVIQKTDGGTRLWKPDLAPYEHKVPLPKGSQPNEQGVHGHEGQDVLRLGGKHYGVTKDPDTNQFRILHSSRPEAYRPRLKHNDKGAWVHEAEQPRTWQGTILMRRLGHTVDEFTDAELEHIRLVSGIDEGALRRLHVDLESPADLLNDTIQRFKFYNEANKELANTPREPLEEGLQERFKRLYDNQQRSNDARVQLLQNDFPDLATSTAQKVLSCASTTELQQMTAKAKVPLRLKQVLRELQFETRISRVYEGLYLSELASADTETMVFNTLRLQPGWSGNVRIDIREHSFNGALRSSIGAPNAPEHKVLIWRADGRYEARDAQGHHLNGASDLFESILRALPDTERNALGYNIGQGQTLRQTLTLKPLPRSELRAVLAEPPLRKTSERETMRLLQGPGYSRIRQPTRGATQSLEDRVQQLYPTFSTDEITAFARSSGTQEQAHQTLNRLELEFEELINDLSAWLQSSTEARTGTVEARNESTGRQTFARALKLCWQRATDVLADDEGNWLGHHLVLQDLPLNTILRSLPELKADFSHVALLDLSNTGFSASEAHFLKKFPALRSLLLRNNHLTTIPPAIFDMPHLRGLALSNNQIALTPQAVAQLRELIHLERLALMNNPLGHVPDVSRMPRLQGLYLGNTGIETWPVGVFGQPRPRNFYLDLQNNRLSTIPEVAPGSPRAEILARTLLSRDQLSAENIQHIEAYIESVGLDPSRSYPSRGELDSHYWLDDLPSEQRAQKQKNWDALEDELGSEPFFNEIRKLTESVDYTSTFKKDLTQKVWRMLDAAVDDTPLREKLFEMATAPTTCVDAGAQLFNSMGVEVLIHEAYALANKDLVEAELLEIAKGKSRLNDLSKIARSTVREREANGETFRTEDGEGNVTGTIDEVEVHLAYMTDLADRLDLPWQSRGMNFREIASVTPAMIESAYERVLALEQGDLLRDSIIDQDFWVRHITGANRRLFKDFGRQINWLIELQTVQKRWVHVRNLPFEERHTLKETLKVLTAQLDKTDGEVFTGQEMKTEDFDRDFNAIVENRNALLKQLTQEAMDRVRLQRAEKVSVGEMDSSR